MIREIIKIILMIAGLFGLATIKYYATKSFQKDIIKRSIKCKK